MKLPLLSLGLVGALALAGCNTNTNNNGTYTYPAQNLTETNLTPTSVTLNWKMAAEGSNTNLWYTVYQSDKDPQYGNFTALEQLQAGTRIGYVQNANSYTVTGLIPGHSYYFNIVVSDGNSNYGVYRPIGEYFDNGLVLDYPFDGNANDITAKDAPAPVAGSNTTAAATTNSTPVVANNGILSATSPTLVPDRFGNINSAYLFSNDANDSFSKATSQYITSSKNLPTEGSFTLSFWYAAVSGHDYTNDSLVGMGAKSENASFAFNPMDSNIHIFTDGGKSDLATGEAPSKTWQHWVVVYDGSTAITAYKNGKQVATASAPNLNIAGGPLYIATNPSQDYAATAYIDDVRVYSDALTSEQVQRLYTVTRP